ncbi:aminopeptidase N [Rhodobacteraceae bacterium XHP0102]|nr:aminopeptidase N [Rhodobacteraceae bacterium XHP0102]
MTVTALPLDATLAPAAPRTIWLSDYTPPEYLIDHVDLTFRLDPKATRVLSRITFRPNPDAQGLGEGALKLDGEGLRLIWAKIDHQTLAEDAYLLSETGLSVPASRLPEGRFVWEAEVEIAPEDNTALEGLYMSKGMYCTQCEAEGFRKITYYPDRPDVMAPFDVRIEGDHAVMLSNGNPVAKGAGFAQWHDPWPKPAYLFALVAGDLRAYSDQFTTASGREVDLNIYVRPGDEGYCAYAMDALKRSMIWDEQVYGREYDLDLFNIVAVDDFNMGAMENKGLNIFNSKYVLASPETATDQDYAFIERIIAHEYFHNWTGNRITCRDWFQLCLKEGLTVFRDQQFSADARSAPVQRIGDVLNLRARQFREDAGPLAHPVRPASFVEINNFYTATVYEKGAELIRMLRLLVGEGAYRAALDLYFDRHDGQACTIEDWLQVFEDITLRDLSQFKRWYEQAGTPRLTVTSTYQDGRLVLKLAQRTDPTPNQPLKEPLLFPVALGLLGQDGRELRPTQIVEMANPEMELVFDDLPEAPVLSVLRAFSAPVILEIEQDFAARATLFAHDTDPFNRWEAGRSLSREVLCAMITDGAAPNPDYIAALGAVVQDDTLDPEFRALCASLPSEDALANDLAEAGVVPDPSVIHEKRRALEQAIATALAPIYAQLFETLADKGGYSPDAASAGKRSLRNVALRALARVNGPDLAQTQFDTATNMTDQLAAFGALLDQGGDVAQQASAAFYDQWHENRIVMDKWFMLQIAHAAPDEAAQVAHRLTEHADFDWKNPNRFRAVIAGLTSANPAGFHAPSGAGYEFLADWLIRMDGKNPQTAARMSTAFETWARYDADRQALIQHALRRIAEAPNISRDMSEMVARMRAGYSQT